MQSNPKKKKDNGGSSFGWVIFLLAIAGGPILNAIQGVLGPGIRLPTFLLPLIIMGLVVISGVVSVLRAMKTSNDDSGPVNRMPNPSTPRERPVNYPMPPIGGDMGMPRWPITTATPGLPQTSQMPSGREKLPTAPKFEPIITPRTGLVGIVGLIILGALAAVVLGGGQP